MKIKKFTFLCREFIFSMAIRSLAVFCGSKNGNNPVFAEHARLLGKLLADQQVRLIYGGGNVGIMGILADTVMEYAGKVTGVIPKVLLAWERQHLSITELIVADDMHERKKMIFERADAALVMPGGFGTLDEMFEMITWNQLSIHDKLIFLLNSAGFYDHLVMHIRQMGDENFLYEEAEKRLVILNHPGELALHL